MSLDEASQAMLAQFAQSGGPAIHESTPAIARMIGPIFAGMTGPGPQVESVVNEKLEGNGGRFRVRVLEPAGQSDSIIVFYHGGGWVLGDIDLQYDHVGRDLVNATNSTVVLVNYRKAPEWPFPTAIEDGYTALRWVAEHAHEFAPPGAPLIVAGDSAGGNIAAVMTQWARDRGGPEVGYQVLIYPVTDCDLDRPSYLAPENQLVLSRDTMAWFWNHYLPDVKLREDPAASPLRMKDLTNLPPALVYVAKYDPLHDEGIEYAEALKQAGVDVTVEEATDQMHSFMQMANILPGYRDGIAFVAGHVNKFINSVNKKAAQDGKS